MQGDSLRSPTRPSHPRVIPLPQRYKYQRTAVTTLAQQVRAHAPRSQGLPAGPHGFQRPSGAFGLRSAGRSGGLLRGCAGRLSLPRFQGQRLVKLALVSTGVLLSVRLAWGRYADVV